MKAKKLKGCIGIIARLGSKRLKDKHLIDINNHPVISYLIQRIKKEFFKEISNKQLEIFILTGSQDLNQKLAETAFEYGISIYFGNDTNIPMRMLELLTNKKFNFIIGIDGDDVLCAPEGMREIYDSILSGNQYVKTIDYPFGMNSMGLTKSFLVNSLKEKEDWNLETGWGWIFDKNKCKQLSRMTEPDERLRFTLDYPEDFSFFEKIIMSELDVLNQNTADIIGFVMEKKIFLENMHLNNKYWENVRTQQSLEIQGSNNG